MSGSKATLLIETLPDGTESPAIRVGPGFFGVPWNKETNSPTAGINLDDFNELIDRKESSTIYPGTPVALPYSLVSLALTPVQVFGTILGPLCRTFYEPVLGFGTKFLAMETLMNDLPFFKTAASQTNLKEDVKQYGLDLDGASKIGCEDEEK